MRWRTMQMKRRKRVAVKSRATAERKLVNRLRRMVSPPETFSGDIDSETLLRLTADHISILHAKLCLLRRISSLCGL
ncbi:PREDICTED: uncharacterized protein LOC109116852 [Tarenaya hassleriana]|uniref:uncharacterized protein LOC109116852 n=1 Tax=Tarenaya hassleriana TaxID=28532 RepID=UPI0008FCF9AD|nr:PREDICTED: uncharacterized protein LOC109116852 [Tarenaya hassleriana]